MKGSSWTASPPAPSAITEYSRCLEPGCRSNHGVSALIPIQSDRFQIDGIRAAVDRPVVHDRPCSALRRIKLGSGEEIAKHHAEKKAEPGNQNVARIFHGLTDAPPEHFPKAESLKGRPRFDLGRIQTLN